MSWAWEICWLSITNFPSIFLLPCFPRAPTPLIPIFTQDLPIHLFYCVSVLQTLLTASLFSGPIQGWLLLYRHFLPCSPLDECTSLCPQHLSLPTVSLIPFSWFTKNSAYCEAHPELAHTFPCSAAITSYHFDPPLVSDTHFSPHFYQHLSESLYHIGSVFSTLFPVPWSQCQCPSSPLHISNSHIQQHLAAVWSVSYLKSQAPWPSSTMATSCHSYSLSLQQHPLLKLLSLSETVCICVSTNSWFLISFGLQDSLSLIFLSFLVSTSISLNSSVPSPRPISLSRWTTPFSYLKSCMEHNDV